MIPLRVWGDPDDGTGFTVALYPTAHPHAPASGEALVYARTWEAALAIARREGARFELEPRSAARAN